MLVFLADLVVATHIAFVIFVFFGAQLFRLHRGFVGIHGACLAYAILISIVGWSCPLTLLEQALRARAGVAVYNGEFLAHYFWSHFGLTGNEVPVAASFITAILAANLLQYWLWRKTEAS